MDRVRIVVVVRRWASAPSRTHDPLGQGHRVRRLSPFYQGLFATLLLTLAMGAMAATSANCHAQEGRLLDLSNGLPFEEASVDPWTQRHAADIICCGAGGDVAGQALLGTIRAGTLILTRNHAAAEPSAKILDTSGNTVLDASDLGLGVSAGLDLTLLTALSQSNELEIRFFGIDNWSTSESASDPTGVRFDGFGIFMPAVQSQRIDYTSRLFNIEVNLRPRVVGGVPLVLGFRSMQLHERLNLSTLDPLPESVDLTTHTNNFLYGFQVGAEPYLLGANGPLRLDGLAKAGIYGNHVTQGTSSPLAGTIGAHDDRVSFVGELGLTVVYRFCPMFAARAGYEMLWIYGVALAPDQSRVTDVTVPSARVNSSATAFYQGAVVSLEFMF